MIPEKIKKQLKPGKIVYFATSSKKSIPNLVAVEVFDVLSNKILIADCHFNKTRKNIKENKSAAMITAGNGGFFQIKGKIDYQTSGKNFNRLVKSLKGTKFKANGIVIMSCDEVYDLDKYKRLV